MTEPLTDRIFTLEDWRERALKAEYERDEAVQNAKHNEGMADCMHMVRQELIECGVIDEKVAPMFVSNAVYRKFLKVRILIQARIDKYDGDMEGADQPEFFAAEWATGAMRDLLVRFDLIMSDGKAS